MERATFTARGDIDKAYLAALKVRDHTFVIKTNRIEKVEGKAYAYLDKMGDCECLCANLEIVERTEDSK